ncbi:MAG: PAS domain S-box protein, partial [Ardenticatenales bacterium]|nr:PAS domain S-box protein [Ardenticatenales bacterium]
FNPQELRLRLAIGKRIVEGETQLRAARDQAAAALVEQTTALAALEASEQRFRSVIEVLNEAVIVINSAGLVHLWNPGAERIFGYPAAQRLGQPLTGLMPERYRAAHQAGLDRLRQGDTPHLMGQTLTLHGLRRDGSEFPLELSIGRWQAGEVVFYSGILRDITQRQATERALQEQTAFVELSHAVAVAANEATSIDAALQAALTLVGTHIGWEVGHVYLRPAGASPHLLPALLWHLSDPSAFAPFRRATEAQPFGPGEGLPGQVLATGAPLWLTDLTEDGTFCRAASAQAAGLQTGVAVPVLVETQVVAILEFFTTQALPQDQPLLEVLGQIGTQLGRVVERQWAAEAQARQAEELARSNTELEQFAYIASHDLQEPLRMVMSYLQLLERRYQDRLEGDALEFIAYAVDGAARMKALINDLLAYSRVGTEEGPPQPIQADRVLQQVLGDLQVRLAESGAHVTHEPLPTVLVAEAHLHQLLQNLIGNALKFQRAHPPQVHIRSQPHADGWLFSVQDNGIGIAPQHVERIFAVFKRLHTQQEYPGTGIGLAICKRIVERHGGQLWVESEVGQGSTFYFTLPRG